MTFESVEIANVVDRFPEDIRERLRDAVFRIADVYRATSTTIERPIRQQLGENVIEFRRLGR